MEKIDIIVNGMSCPHCEKAVVNALEDIGASATASHENNLVSVEFDSSRVSLEEIRKEILDVGYEAC